MRMEEANVFRRFWWAGVVVAVAALAAPVGLVCWQHWQAVPLPSLPRPAPPAEPPGIIIHHSATPGTLRGQPVGAAKIDELHKKRGFAVSYHGKMYHIGYHYVIREDGTIETGRPEHCLGAHAKITAYNHYLGICLIGNFAAHANPHHFEPSVPTGPQLRSLVWLCARLAEKYHFPTNHLLRHQDVRQTACPGENFPYYWLLWEVERYRPVLREQMAARAGHRGAHTASYLAASSGTMHDVKVNE
jgi:hypothetical protein